MKPFFSIRIEWNPADSEDQSHRDLFLTRRTVARQTNPCPEWVLDDQKRNEPLREDTSSVVTAIVECIHDLNDEAKWTLPTLIEDIVFGLANRDGLEEHILEMAEIAVDGCSDEFIDSLQKLIDDERKKQAQP
jgi:hypothetical protein